MKTTAYAKVAERRGDGGVLAISEMAVKINEWKSSLSSSVRCAEYGRSVNEHQWHGAVDESSYVACTSNKNGLLS